LIFRNFSAILARNCSTKIGDIREKTGKNASVICTPSPRYPLFATPLTDVKIRQAKTDNKPIKITDADGLYVEMRPSGSKLWRYRHKIVHKENVFSLGEYTARNFTSTALNDTHIPEWGLATCIIA
jgi:hypothetical protein